MLRRIVTAATLCAGLALMDDASRADIYPSQPIRIVVPTAPGGPLDVLGRLMAQRLKETWGATVIIENRPGGVQMIGANAVAKSAPDGYTLLFANDGPITIGPNLYNKMPYDPKKELVPVTMVVDAPFIMVVSPSVQAKSVSDLIALAKANPGKINFASGGNTSRFATELFRLATDIQIVSVPYNGSGQAIVGVISGEVHMMIDGITSSLPQVEAGKLRALGVGTLKPLKEIPGVPPIAETVPGYVGQTWLGLFAPAGTPSDIVNKIQTEVSKVVHEPEIRERLVKLGMYPVANPPQAFAKFLDEDTEKWGRVVRDAKIQKLD